MNILRIFWKLAKPIFLNRDCKKFRALKLPIDPVFLPDILADDKVANHQSRPFHLITRKTEAVGTLHILASKEKDLKGKIYEFQTPKK